MVGQDEMDETEGDELPGYDLEKECRDLLLCISNILGHTFVVTSFSQIRL